MRGRQLRVRIDQRLPLAQAAEAHRILEGRGTTGKVLLIPLSLEQLAELLHARAPRRLLLQQLRHRIAVLLHALGHGEHREGRRVEAEADLVPDSGVDTRAPGYARTE